MVLKVKRYTASEFDEFVDLAENADRLFELIGGEIVEVPSNPYSSKIASRINRYLGAYVDDNDLGHVTGEAGGYIVAGERYAPDVAFISKERQPDLPQHGYNPNPPNLAVEVVSPTDTDKRLRIKIANYLAAGTIVWVVYPETQEVEVYHPGMPVKILDTDDVLTADDILPDFKLPIKDMFTPKSK